MAFKHREDYTIVLEASPIVDVPTLSCRIHDFLAENEVFYVDDKPFIRCVIPNYKAILLSAIRDFPSNDVVVVEYSNNGIDFS